MKITTTEYYCDICNSKTNNKEKELTVVFTTEQNEGLGCYPYFQHANVVLCDECEKKILFDGMQIFASGAMGCNEYFFKKRKER